MRPSIIEARQEKLMAERPLHDLIRYIHRLAEQGDGALSDAELLSRFVERRDEAAFEALVWRHGQLIWGLCRRLLRNQQDAEDAFQATFLVLARKAKSVRQRDAVGGWLYQVAQRIALEMRRKNQAAQVLPVVASQRGALLENAERADLRETLEEEIAFLPPKYRLPAVLRYLEGKSTVETAAIVGCPPGTVLSRLAWARRRLGVRLNKRGIGLVLALSAAAASESSAVASAPCVLATVSAALAFVHRKTVNTGRSVLLAQGVIRAMWMTKLTAGSFALLGLITAAAGIGMGVWPGPRGEGSPIEIDETPATRLAQDAGKAPIQAKANKSDPRNQQGKAIDASPDLPEVTFVRPLLRMVGDHVEFVGRTEAAQTVTIRPRISSTLEKIDVNPGAVVKQGDLLFELDASLVRAEYDKAAGELKRAQAQVEQAQATHEYSKSMVTKGLASPDVVVASNAKVAEAKAALAAAQAGVERARLDVDATKITAPIAGRIGQIELDVGNAVGPNTKLATLVSLSPVYASFDIDEATFRTLQRYFQQPNSAKPIEALMKLHGDELERKGALYSIDNSFDPKTGTVRARAKFPDEKDEVRPGMFAKVQLRWGEPREALIIPDATIQRRVVIDQDWVHVITPENVIEHRIVTVGKLEPAGRVILSGLTPKDRVMTGARQGEITRQGVRVRATEATTPKPQNR
jgi:RND family efflux transporter MFP subunit